MVCGDAFHSGLRLGDVESLSCGVEQLNHFELAKVAENDVVVRMDTRPLAHQPPFVHYQLHYNRKGNKIDI